MRRDSHEEKVLVSSIEDIENSIFSGSVDRIAVMAILALLRDLGYWVRVHGDSDGNVSEVEVINLKFFDQE